MHCSLNENKRKSHEQIGRATHQLTSLLRNRAVFYISDYDKHFLYTRKIYCVFGCDFLILTKLAFNHLGDFCYGNTSGKTATYAACNKQITNINLVRSLRVLYLNGVR